MDDVVIQKGTGSDVMILIHGRGASPESILPLADALEFTGTVYAPRSEKFGWYPQRFIRPQSENEPDLSRAIERIHAIVTEFNTANVVIAGFSQGACLATHYAALHPGRYKAILAFSGGLIGVDEEVKVTESLEQTPVLLSCAQDDPHIPAERVQRTHDLFTNNSANVNMQLYPDSMHTVRPEEIELAKAILRQ